MMCNEVARTKKVKVIHKACGGQTGWYLGLRDQAVAISSDFERMDGTKPDESGGFDEVCANCHKRIYGTNELIRMFDDRDTED